jgi:hypothetical protein
MPSSVSTTRAVGLNCPISYSTAAAGRAKACVSGAITDANNSRMVARTSFPACAGEKSSERSFASCASRIADTGCRRWRRTSLPSGFTRAVNFSK